MNELRQSAILVSLVDHLQSHGSWCGETHVQKTTYFLQELLNVPLLFEFIIYKYGPFSFELKDMLVSMRADSLIELVPSYPGSTIVAGKLSDQIRKRFPDTLKTYEPQIEFVTSHLGKKQVNELEALSTAFFIQKNNAPTTSAELIGLLQKIKPHIKDELARRAIKEIQELKLAARDVTI
ncbi:MAG TPA: hypothetical protein VF435_18025 [Pyrinomonadaceae bacterium]